MSLQVWLPLNGDLRNNGLSGVTVTNNNATVNTAGKIGSCYSFSGSSQYLRIDKKVIKTSEYSISFWMYTTDVSSNHCIFSTRNINSGAVNIYSLPAGIRFDTSNSANWATGFKPTINTWYHLTLVQDATTKYIYVNGVLNNSIAGTTNLSQVSDVCTIGCEHINGSSIGTYFPGRLNDVRIYDHALSPKEIKLLSQGLVCHYQLNDINTETIVYDSSGNKYNGEKVGNVTSSNISPRNTTSMSFVNGSYLRLQNMTVSGYTNSYTFAWWGKFGNCNGHMMWGFANGNRLNLFSYSTNCYWNTGDSSSNPFNVALSPYLDSNFHHFAITGDGTTTKLYIDGEYKANAKTYKGITGTTLIFNGWDTGNNYNFNGSLSDFRLYATPLSAKDIQTLYNTPVSVTNAGTMTTYGEFVEVTSS